MYVIFTSAISRNSNCREIWFSFTGNHWISGVWILLKGTFYGGQRIITTQTFDAHLMLKLIDRYQVTTTIMTPMWQATFDCESMPLNSMKYLVVGGFSASRRMCNRAKRLFPNSKICHSYGASETGLLAINLTNTKLESVGQLYNNVEMKVHTAFTSRKCKKFTFQVYGSLLDIE